jgi:hypothetical protein
MKRRGFLQGVAVAGVGLTALPACSEEKAGGGGATAPMIAACGLACTACPAMIGGKCKGCATGKTATEEMLKMKPCAVLKCAAMKKIDYCGSCKMFTQCAKLVGQPYDKAFIEKLDKKLKA